MTDTDYSDDERYANESFENETDTEVPEMSEIESETSENSEDDEDDDDELPSVKLNTGPIKRNSFSHNLNTLHKTDAVPFASSSDEEDDVIVGQTMAEINTPSMHFEDESPKPAARQFMPHLAENNHRLKSVEEETHESSEEISEEDDDDDEEFNRIKDMEEKYIQLNSGKALQDTHNATTNSFEKEKKENDIENQQKDAHHETESEDEAEEEQQTETDERNEETTSEENLNRKESLSDSSSEVCDKTETKPEEIVSIESLAENNLMQLLQNSITNLNLTSSDDNKDILLMNTHSQLIKEIQTQSIDMTNILNPEALALAVVNALKSSGLTSSSSLLERDNTKPMTIEEIQEDEYKEDCEKSKNENNSQSNGDKEIEIVDYKDDYEEEEEVEVEADEFHNTDHNAEAGSVNYDDERDVYYDAHFDYRITSKTPTSFNSDDYIFHANFIKQFHRTNSTDKLRVKPHPRKSMSFSNERMREIERHNQILLRKILTQKPTYTLKSKTSQTSIQKTTSQSNTRLTTSAVNRKKQQRQIDLDNQILKRKIEAIALRRRPLIS